MLEHITAQVPVEVSQDNLPEQAHVLLAAAVRLKYEQSTMHSKAVKLQVKPLQQMHILVVPGARP